MQYILTQEEYDELISSKPTYPDEILAETNKNLKQKLDECQAKLEQGSFDKCTIESPFIVTNEHLCMRSPTDFVVLYNSLAQPTLNGSDEAMFNYITKLATMLNYEPQFATQRDLKAYRVSLNKKQLYNKVMRDGICYLEIQLDSILKAVNDN